jgi:Yip1 domain
MDKQYLNVVLNFAKNPGLSFSNIIANKLDRYKFWLIFLLGISVMSGNAISSHYGDKFGMIGLILYIFILGPIFVALWVFMVSALISITGRWIKGNAKIEDVMNIISYAAIPLILMLVVRLLYVIIFGTSIFYQRFNLNDFGTLGYLVYKLGFVINVILLVYYFILLVLGISVVQGFSIMKGIFNILFAVFLFVLPFLIIGFLIAKFR